MYLNSHSHFSLRYGIMSPKELFVEAKKNNVETIALTDINYTGACQEFMRIAPQYGIKPVIGIDFRNGAKQVCIALAKNNQGFYDLNNYLSYHLYDKLIIPSKPLQSDHVYIIYPYASYRGQLLADNEWVGINYRDINLLPFGKYAIPENKIVILHTATFRDKKDFNAHRLLRAIDNNTLLSKLPKSEEGDIGDRMLTQKQFQHVYRQYQHAISNTMYILDQCNVVYDDNHKNQQHYKNSAREDLILVKQLCDDGLRYRYGEITPVIKNRLDKEMETITEQGFLSYFLINWRITQYARQRGYFYVGRGSGANSLVAYLLRITDVDPIELDLYFERFINLYRKNPPDFDVDFSWRDREDITQFIFNEFDHVALLGMYSTFQTKAVLRELGKVFGLPSHEIERAQSARVSDGQLDHLSRLVRRYGALIKDQPNYLSVHAGGILISQKPMHYYTATELPPKGFATTQFDMVTAEDIGLYKFDILSQRGLGKIKDTLSIIAQNQPDEPDIDIHHIERFKKDGKVKAMLKKGKAIGCFYVESPAMRMLLRKLKVDHYLGLVAASSVIRPGVAKSGMMREYILRFRYPERRKDAHPIMLEIMPETFGVMVYQEDVIKVAHYFAELSPSEADVLRRGMSGKYRSRAEFQMVRDKFFTNCHRIGHTPKLTQEIWRQIESFAGYAFAKGHSASYAVESYQSLFLKAHYPLEYMVAVVNNGGGFYRPDLYLHEARLHGATILPPCVNTSLGSTTIHGQDIYLGLTMLRELEHKTTLKILELRQVDGPFGDLYDFVHRTAASLEQVSILIRIGAFRFTGVPKKALLWEAHFLLGNTKPKVYMPQLFETRPKSYTLPNLDMEDHEDAFDQIELLGFPLCSPFLLARDGHEGYVTAADLHLYGSKVISSVGYLITVKNTTTSSGKRMNFGTFIDEQGMFLDTVHFPPVAARYPFRGRGLYLITGKVVEEFGFYTIEVQHMERLAYIEDPRYADEVRQKV